MTHILFDLIATQPIGKNLRHGGGKYGEMVLMKIIEKDIPTICFFDSERWINPAIVEFLNEKKIELIDINVSSIQDVINERKISLVYSALPNRHLFCLKNVRIIGTLHGLRRLETPADSYCFRYRNLNWKDWLFYLMNTCFPKVIKNKLINYYRARWNNKNYSFITVSNHTANSLKVFFPEFKKTDIPVFYSPSTISQDIAEVKYTGKFFLLVSANRLEKNNLRAIKALDMLYSEGYLSGFRVKITGANDASNFRCKIKNLGNFDFLGYVDDKELEQLYHDAYALIYPSLNEGFGYPPLEAMHYGTPVLASPYSSIPEVCGSAALYFNPFSVEEIAARILYITDIDVRYVLSKKSYDQFMVIVNKQHKDLDAFVDYLKGVLVNVK